MTSKTRNTAGWILTGVIALLLAFSAFLKISQAPEAVAQAAASGIDAATFRLIGIIEIICVLVFLIPRTAFAGSLLLVAYMGGAIASHLINGDSVVLVVVIEALVWITILLRFPVIQQQLLPLVRSDK
ncbi:DoxX family protein [Ravibacter arvi]|uniref:DoxX family protein n=1 Tax=Ravibacter arvi TaxID=2051041 RepID=A0ABP8LXB8_9BACT